MTKENDMKKAVIIFALFLTLGSTLVSCSHHDAGTPERYAASESCTVKGEYHSYFDETEKCIEKEKLK